MLLLVGLGNPGPEHEKNRHNIGFMAVDEIVRRHSFGAWRARFHALVAEGRLADRKVLAMKPTTFMNESGRAVAEAVRWYKLAPGDVLVIHDELDLTLGKVRLKYGGGHAGHNGLRSIIAHIGSDFARLRLGIGHPGRKDKVHGYVLSDFAKPERPAVRRLVEAIAEAAPMLVDAGQHNAFMTRIALVMKPPRQRSAASPASASPQKDTGNGS